jgi:adenylate cyclase
MLAQLAMIIGFPFGLQAIGVDTLSLPVAGGAAGWVLAFIAIGSAVRAVNAEERSFAQGALGKYLPRDIAQEILRDPSRLALHGEKKAIYCLFSDLEGFTSMSHAMSPENVAFVLNAYLDTLSEVILDHGGTIDKFVGDAVVAFWGAPIQRADDAHQASRALLAMAQAGDAFSRRMSMEMGGTLPPVGRTRVGLHYGEAVVGNFGGEGRIQYTALGDSMNTAARLEGANKQMKSRALVSAEALAPLAEADRAIFVPMGRIQLRGRSQPVDAFEPRPDLTPEQRAMVADLVAAHGSGKGDAYRAQRDALLSAELPQRGSIDFLIERLEMTEAGEFYALA